MSDAERDPRVSERYRALGAEEPPRALDQAILAAARREVEARPAPLVAPTGRRRWYVPLAAAAVIVLSVAVSLHLQLEEPGMNGVPPGERKGAPQPAQPAEPAAKQERAAEEAPRAAPKVDVAAAEKRAAEARAEPPRLAQDPPLRAEAERAPARPLAKLERTPASAPLLEPTERGAAAARSAPAAPAMQRDERAAAAREQRSLAQAPEIPEKALERIAELRRAGRHDEADKALAEFRKRHPDYKIPEAMLERVERR